MLMFYVGITLGFRASKDIDGTVCPYIIWLLSGMVAWFYISDLLGSGPTCYRIYKPLLIKAGYPVSVIPMVAVINNLFIHVILVFVTMIAAILLGVRPSIYWLQLPVLTCMIILFTYLWTFMFGMLTAVSADTINLIRSIKPAFFWLSGILFNSRTRHSIVFDLNPITYLVESYRSAIAYNMWFWELREKTEYFFMICLIMLIVSLILYKRLKDKLPEAVIGG
jgi:ABC-type polysaccharide/polyol phosphate export permease